MKEVLGKILVTIVAAISLGYVAASLFDPPVSMFVSLLGGAGIGVVGASWIMLDD